MIFLPFHNLETSIASTLTLTGKISTLKPEIGYTRTGWDLLHGSIGVGGLLARLTKTRSSFLGNEIRNKLWEMKYGLSVLLRRRKHTLKEVGA